MKEIILDLRNIEVDAGDSWADSPDRVILENILMDYIGQIIRVRITKCKEATND